MSDGLRVTVLGIGRMGGAMVRRLRGAGLDVTVWNRSQARAGEIAAETGAEAVTDAREAVAEADVVISSLADDAAVLETYGEPVEAAKGLRAGTVALEMSTIAPATIHRIAPLVEASGASLLDAPVSGSVPVVERGEITVMAGGDPAALDRARPVLAAFATNVLHMGPQGAGATVKLAVNSLVHAMDVGLSEALVLAEKAGVERSAAYEVFASGAVAAPWVLYKRQSFEHPEETPAMFRLDLMAKDLDLALALAAEVGAATGQIERNREIVGAAIDAGYGERDQSIVATYLRNL